MNLPALAVLILSMASVYTLEIYKKHGNYKKHPVVKGGDAWYMAPSWIRLPPVLFYGVAVTSLLEIFFNFSDWLTETVDLPLVSVTLALLQFMVGWSSKARQTRQYKRLSVAVMFGLGMVLASFIYNVFND